MSNAANNAFLLDANVWIDYFIDRGCAHDTAIDFIVKATRKETALYTPIEVTKDVYYIVASELKNQQRNSSGHVSPSSANAANELAWSCLSAMRKRSTIVAADSSDMIEAMVQRANHDDYEDNLVIAAAKRAGANYIVTSDAKLRKHAPVNCVSLSDALQLVSP